MGTRWDVEDVHQHHATGLGLDLLNKILILYAVQIYNKRRRKNKKRQNVRQNIVGGVSHTYALFQVYICRVGMRILSIPLNVHN